MFVYVHTIHQHQYCPLGQTASPCMYVHVYIVGTQQLSQNSCTQVHAITQFPHEQAIEGMYCMHEVTHAAILQLKYAYPVLFIAVQHAFSQACLSIKLAPPIINMYTCTCTCTCTVLTYELPVSVFNLAIRRPCDHSLVSGLV